MIPEVNNYLNLEYNNFMDAAKKVSPMQPGSDSRIHDQTLQQGVAENLSQVLKTKVEPADVAPGDQEESFGERVGEELEALNPFEVKTVRTAPNTDQKKEGFLNLLLGRIRKQHPGQDLKEN